MDEYLAGLDAELGMRFGSDDRWELDTLYLGGGTPSRLGGAGIARLIDLVRTRARLSDGAEVTVEANPDDVDPAAVATWRAAGVNRISLGVQSFDDRVLRWMHRVHDAAAALRAVETIRGEGIRDLSVDLIFALPAERERDWTRDLEMAVALQPTHLSLYGLTVEHHTPAGRWRERGEFVEAPEERYEQEFLEADRRLAGAGLAHYEVSNFGVAGHRARHNSSYWAGVPYGGIGPAAHEYNGAKRRWNVAPYAHWIRQLERGEDPIGGEEVLTEEERSDEAVYLGLRTVDGLAVDGSEILRAERWIEAGWVTLADGILRLTPLGWLRLDAIAADLTVVRSR